jgi:hypothetical protein
MMIMLITMIMIMIMIMIMLMIMMTEMMMGYGQVASLVSCNRRCLVTGVGRFGICK